MALLSGGRNKKTSAKEAIQQVRTAERVDPISYEVHFDAAYAFLAVGKYSEASVHCEKLPADAPDKTWCLTRLELEQGKPGESIRMLEAAARRRGKRDDHGNLGFAYARAGRRQEAEAVVATIADPISQAHVFAALGDRDRALEALDRGTAIGPFRVGRALAFPEFAFLRGDPRMKAVRKKVGLPE